MGFTQDNEETGASMDRGMMKMRPGECARRWSPRTPWASGSQGEGSGKRGGGGQSVADTDLRWRWNGVCWQWQSFNPQGRSLLQERDEISGGYGRHLDSFHGGWMPLLSALPNFWTLRVPLGEQELFLRLEWNSIYSNNYFFCLGKSLIIILISSMVIYLLNFSITSDHFDILWFFSRNLAFQLVL